jgi:bifunctional DNA-binding transcriptional regulator/antitoxin component of YhaV-PrlF toxin-antitoxin module
VPNTPTTTTLKGEADLIVPAHVRRKAGIKSGDRLQFVVSPRTILIRASEPTYSPTKTELAAIRKGEAAIARGDVVSLDEFLHDLGSRRRKAGTKTRRKVSQ